MDLTLIFARVGTLGTSSLGPPRREKFSMENWLINLGKISQSDQFNTVTRRARGRLYGSNAPSTEWAGLP